MTIIPQDMIEGQELNTSFLRFFTKFKVSKILNQCNAYKEKGVSVMDLFRYLFCIVFTHRSMYMQILTGSFKEDFSKNSVYRFLNNEKINWQKFTTLLAAKIINSFMKPLTDDNRQDVFIIDDSLFERSRSKKTELVSRVFDHCTMTYKKGFRLLTWVGQTATHLFQSTAVSWHQTKTATSIAMPRNTIKERWQENAEPNQNAKQQRSCWNYSILQKHLVSRQNMYCLTVGSLHLKPFFESRKEALTPLLWSRRVQRSCMSSKENVSTSNRFTVVVKSAEVDQSIFCPSLSWLEKRIPSLQNWYVSETKTRRRIGLSCFPPILHWVKKKSFAFMENAGMSSVFSKYANLPTAFERMSKSFL